LRVRLLSVLGVSLALLAAGLADVPSASASVIRCNDWHFGSSNLTDLLRPCIQLDGTQIRGSGHYEGHSRVTLTVIVKQCRSASNASCGVISANRGAVSGVGSVYTSGKPVAGGHWYRTCVSISYGAEGSFSDNCSPWIAIPV
jgi:hypothetical protein